MRLFFKGLPEQLPGAYLDWGAATVAELNDRTLSPDQCSSYLLRHYTAHILDSRLPPDRALDDHLLPLLDEGWMRAWEEDEGVAGSYLMDVNRVRETLRKSNASKKAPPYRIGAEIRTALIRSSIWSRQLRLFPDLVVALADSGVWTLNRAIREASNFSALEDRAHTLLLLARYATGQEREHVHPLALAAVDCIRDENARSRMLAAVNLQSIIRDARHEAPPVADGSAAGTARPKREASAENQLPGTGCGLPFFKKLATSPNSSLSLLGNYAELCCEAERREGPPRRALLDEALGTIRGMEDVYFRASGLLDVSWRLPDIERREVLSEALATATGIDDQEARDRAIHALNLQLSCGTQSTGLDRSSHDSSMAAAGTWIENENRGPSTPADISDPSPNATYTSISDAIDMVKHAPRKVYCKFLSDLASTVEAFGGKTAIREAIDAIRNVGRWWP